MTAVFAVLGALLGLVLGSMGRSPALGLLSGLAIGLLFDRVRMLRADLETQRKQLDALQRQQHAEEKLQPRSRAVEPTPAAPDESFEPPATPVGEPAATVPARVPAAQTAGPAPDAGTRSPWVAAEPLERAFAAARDWLTSGNVPAKVGMLVSFFGVSFLLKYAIDRNLLNLPIEVRLLAVALAGAVVAGLGWRLRARRPTYALVLQGGGLGILFLTVYAALRIWQLIPAPAAFVLLALLAATTAALAVVQNARTLAMFGVAGGFLAPLLASTGQGSHVVLFGYYLLLNLAILAIAWRRAWRGLNLLGFGFTFVIALFWGYRYFRPELFGSTEPFLVAHFLLYQAVALLYALRRPPDRPDLVDGTLVFGTPVIAFGLQSAMLSNTEYGLAISAAALAMFYAAGALVLRGQTARLPGLLAESWLALAVAFGTVAIPLAFDARWTTAAWALEGAALVWVGVRQGRLLAATAGAALVFLAGLVFVEGGWQRDAGLPVLNGNVLGGAMISLSALFAARRLAFLAAPEPLAPVFRVAGLALLAWGVTWWLGTGWAEILDRVPLRQHMPSLVAFTAASGAAGVALGRWRDWSALCAATAAHLPLLGLLAAATLAVDDHFLFGLGWVAWPAAWAVQVWLLRDVDAHERRYAGAWHIGSLLLLSAMLAIETNWQVARFASRDWADVTSVVVLGLAVLMVRAAGQRQAWPVARRADAYLAGGLALAGLHIVAMTSLALDRPGDSAPLAYLPVLNPLGLGSAFALLTAGTLWRSARDRQSDAARPLLAVCAGLAFVLTSAAIVRAVHHYTGVAWQFETLFASERVQTALSIFWGLLGFAGMLVGARRAARAVWFAGAACMALVLVKLFLVDLGNSGTVERIVSFIGTGALLLIVGYFAPVPPRTTEGSPEPR